MFEFVCGFLSGVIGFVMFKKRLVNRCPSRRGPGTVPTNFNSKFIPELRNFWGPDS